MPMPWGAALVVLHEFMTGHVWMYNIMNGKEGIFCYLL